MRYSKSNGFVYAIIHEHDFVKIGESHDPVKRMNDMNTATPYDLYLYTTISVVGEAETVEKRLHDVYEDDWVTGEWFDISEQDLEVLASINEVHESVVEHIDNWTPSKHLDMPEEKLHQHRMAGNEQLMHEEALEIVELVESGNFPQENINEDNNAIQRRAKKVDVAPGTFADHIFMLLEEREAEADKGDDDV